MSNDLIWQTKLAARIHDPAEKALVLLRDPAGHEGGTSRALRRLLDAELQDTTDLGEMDPDNAEVLARVIFPKGLPRAIYRHVQRADWWAAAGDRPQWPMEEITVQTKAGPAAFKVAPWAQVHWTRHPVLIHPLSGAQYDIGAKGALRDTELDDLKKRSYSHFENLLRSVRAPGEQTSDPRKTLLAYWRFGPELREEDDNGRLGELWKVLPADTRVPDHSIWDHLDLTSAFAGAFSADLKGEASLLTMSIGPVQPFIAAARTTSDLWAGSHLLARLAWEAMRPVCEALGPDAILFPRLRGVPQVDLWLRDQMQLPGELFQDCEWMRGGTDSNPLFAAALPNRFVAVVPSSEAKSLAGRVETAVREWLHQKGQEVVDRLLEEAGLATGDEQHCHQQMAEQLRGFPEVHWAVVPFSLILPRNDKQTDLDTTALSAAMAPFFGVAPDQPSGFLDTPAWKVLRERLSVDGNAASASVFFAPNPGVLYPAVYDLAERALAAAKAVRPFVQSIQTGWRCSLTGETEWLCTDPQQLQRSYRQRTDTLWARIATAKPAWAKSGEHLGGLSALKRLWPTLFAEEVGQAVGSDIGRFVVSTHTMALASQIDDWLARTKIIPEGLREEIEQRRVEPTALPRKLMRRHAGHPLLDLAKRLPALLDMNDDNEAEQARVQRLVCRTLAQGQSADADKAVALEGYYGLLLMDGDRMGQMLSGDPASAISYLDSFHPQVRRGFSEHAQRHPTLRAYGAQLRAMSPGRHLAISGALNDFSLTVVRHVVEEEHLGRLIYAGGDDVLAMLPVVDLLPAMQRLRLAYAGHDPAHAGGRDAIGLTLHKGYAILGTRLMRMMGERATASCGAVIAHHQAPLTAVRRELEAAEKRAKNEGGRDALSITVIKRSGGALRLTAKWGEPVALLMALREFLAAPGVSRRAVYAAHEWLVDLPEPAGDGAMLQSLLAYQFNRQSRDADANRQAPSLAQRLTELALGQGEGQRLDWIQNFMSVAEFLARESRNGADA